ncbi:hypothetical protein H7F15_00175 [Pontibacter sp. Tf4]|uniref:hypothetical protein n=1 Tax=Pontibacter sp. Tf4 TaxID=2761620 RepID=UPI001627B2E4|nr:hypothetical protein [Pontibacter sp. Tf4]MBB6609441.1 hypothetical protein [Pontibacter sp. Tf4]
MHEVKFLLLIPMIAAVVFALAMSGWMKSILNEKGYKSRTIDFGISHLNDYPAFLLVIMTEDDALKKRKYKRIFWLNILAIVVFITMAVLMVKL